MEPKIPLALSTWDERELLAIEKVTNSGLFTMGKYVTEYEKDFCKYMGSKYAVMVNSGSSANLLVTAALFFTKDPRYRLNRGDEIIVPAVSWSTSYYPLQQYGLKLKFVDIDLHTLNYDISKLREAVTGETRAILIVNLLGNPNDYDSIREIIWNKRIVIIEDNCESLGAKYHDIKSGCFGVMGTNSSYFSHHMSTIEGGTITTDNEELYHILLSIRSHGWTRHLPEINHITGIKDKDPFVESFKFVLPGYNLRPIEFQGAIGVEQLKKLDTMIEVRRNNAKKFESIMNNHPKIIIQKEIGMSSWFGFSLVIRPGSGMTLVDLRSKLRDLGIEHRPIVAGNFANNEVMKYFDYSISGTLDNANYISSNGLFIGNHHLSFDKELDLLKQL